MTWTPHTQSLLCTSPWWAKSQKLLPVCDRHYSLTPGRGVHLLYSLKTLEQHTFSTPREAVIHGWCFFYPRVIVRQVFQTKAACSTKRNLIFPLLFFLPLRLMFALQRIPRGPMQFYVRLFCFRLHACPDEKKDSWSTFCYHRTSWPMREAALGRIYISTLARQSLVPVSLWWVTSTSALDAWCIFGHNLRCWCYHGICMSVCCVNEPPGRYFTCKRVTTRLGCLQFGNWPVGRMQLAIQDSRARLTIIICLAGRRPELVELYTVRRDTETQLWVTDNHAWWVLATGILWLKILCVGLC